MSSQNKLLLLGLGALILSGCGATPAAGTIPMLTNGEQSPPDISAKYVEEGAWFNSSKNEKLDYPDFADKKCQDRGYKRYKAYEGGFATKSSIAGLPSGDTTRTIDIWCE
jgi:hypothetical protein